MFNNKLKKMEKRRKLPKVVMAVSVAAMGMGLFSTLQNEARATGVSKCYKNINTSTGGLTDFCSNSVCVEKNGTGNSKSRCGS